MSETELDRRVGNRPLLSNYFIVGLGRRCVHHARFVVYHSLRRCHDDDRASGAIRTGCSCRVVVPGQAPSGCFVFPIPQILCMILGRLALLIRGATAARRAPSRLWRTVSGLLLLRGRTSAPPLSAIESTLENGSRAGRVRVSPRGGQGRVTADSLSNKSEVRATHARPGYFASPADRAEHFPARTCPRALPPELHRNLDVEHLPSRADLSPPRALQRTWSTYVICSLSCACCGHDCPAWVICAMAPRSRRHEFWETISVTFSRAISSQRNKRYCCKCVEGLPLRRRRRNGYTTPVPCIMCCSRSVNETSTVTNDPGRRPAQRYTKALPATIC